MAVILIFEPSLFHRSFPSPLSFIMSYSDERRPLLPRDDYSRDDVHDQFCQLVGVPPSDLPAGRKWRPPGRSLYERASDQRRSQSLTYQMTAFTNNFLLLSQVCIGAAVTGMGASGQSHIWITLLGAANTIIAGLVAYLKSRGQPMRARMYRDDLERVVDEIENSEIMWLGISKGVNGYDDIDTEDSVTVRSEVARLTRLYDKAVRNNTLNNPDLYGSGGEGGMAQAALRNRGPGGSQVPAALPPGPASAAPDSGADAPAPAPAPAQPEVTLPLVADPDESPATAKPTAPTAVKVVVGAEVPKKDDGDKSSDATGAKPNGDANVDGEHDGSATKKPAEETPDTEDSSKKPDVPDKSGESDV